MTRMPLDSGPATRPAIAVLACALVLLPGAAARAGADVRLIEAARKRNHETVRTLLKQNVDVNAAQSDGATPLHWAAHWDDAETAELLIRAGARVNTANDYGITPLSLACTNGSAAMVGRLLNAGADPKIALPDGETPLMTAARSGNVDVVQLLIASGADVNAKESIRGQTALMWAAGEGHAPVVRKLIASGASPQIRSQAGFTPLLLAARGAHLDATRALLDHGVSVNEAAPDGLTALVIASIRGHLDYAAFLIDRGADPNIGPGFTPLHWAVGEWHTELTGQSTGVTAEATEWSTLGGLRGPQKLQFVKLLLAHGSDPNAKATKTPRYSGGGGGGNLAGATPFLMAAKAGDAAVMRLLLASGADPRTVTTRHSTALMMAAGVVGAPGISWVAESDALEAVTLALELGGDVNAADDAGETALHGAAYRGWDRIVQLLVDKGARLNVKNKKGWTPLTIAEGVYSSNFNVFPSTAELLRKLGAEPTPPGVERDGTVQTQREQ